MVIDAMDLVYSERFDGFCIVSSAGKFTGVYTRDKRHRPGKQTTLYPPLPFS